jgi:hypothetical protein
MRLKIHIRRDALLASCIVAVAALTALGSASTALAAAKTCGSGATVQKSIQEVWTKEYNLKGPGSVTYNSTSSGEGLEDFGYIGSVLKDDAKCGASPGELDGFIGVDSPPNLAELELAEEAAGSKAAGEITGVEVPVAQVPLALLASAPTDVEVNGTDSLAISNETAAEAYAGTIPKDTPYPANTWGALLLLVWSLVSKGFLTMINSGSPTTGEFLDTGTEAGKSGGFTPISVEVRANGAGATLVFKQYFVQGIALGGWSSIPVNESTGSGQWPSTASQLGSNTTDALEAEATANTPGDVGYSTVGAALLAPNAFSFLPLDITIGTVLHWIWWWELENNFKSGETTVQYANPALSETTEEANVYAGSKINVNNLNTKNVGNWMVPEVENAKKEFVFAPLGDWTAGANPTEYTHAWDPNVFVHSGSEERYPLVISLWDICWNLYNVGNLPALYKEKPIEVGETVEEYLKFVTGAGATEGQTLAKTKSEYFGPLPTGGVGTADIRADAHAAAEVCALND